MINVFNFQISLLLDWTRFTPFVNSESQSTLEAGTHLITGVKYRKEEWPLVFHIVTFIFCM